MDNINNLIFELLIIIFFAGLYYLYTRRKIVLHFEYEVHERMEQLIYEIHCFLEENKNSTDYSLINEFVINLEEILNNRNFDFLKSLDVPQNLNKEFKNQFKDICNLF